MKNIADVQRAWKQGYKVFPENLATMLGLPYIGNIFYIDPANGSDTANNGKSVNRAFATIAAAHDAMTAYNHDVAILVPGSTAGTSETAAVTWSKDYCHLIGNTGPVRLSQRSRVLMTTDSVDPAFTISARGCIFSNIQFASFQDSVDVLVELTGDRNYFSNVHFAGLGTATAGDDATGRDLNMTGAVENTFEGCAFGLDTAPRSAANACLGFNSSSSKNVWENCIFNIQPDNVGALFIKSAGADGCSGWNLFKGNTFIAQWTNAADKITAAIDISAQTQTANMIFDGYNTFVGCDDIEGTASGHVWFPQVIDTNPGTYAGLAVNNA